MLERIAKDDLFNLNTDELATLLDPKDYIGMAPEQTEDFLKNYVKPVLDKYKNEIGLEVEINV